MRKLTDGQAVLVGNTWDPDVDSWPQNLCIPRKDASERDPDDFESLKRLTEKLIKDEEFAKTVSIHNLTAMKSFEKPTTIIRMWPSPDRGYTAKHRLK